MKFGKNNKFNVRIAAVVAIIVSTAGILILPRTLAGGHATSLEVELGTIIGGARVVNDSNASGGKVLVFGTATTPTPTPTPAPTPTSTPTATPTPTATSTPSTGAKMPAQILNLLNWKLTLPINTAHAGSPDEITQPELATYSIDPWFVSNSTGTGVRFRANAAGATTANTAYPRSELREMTSNGTAPASWSNTSGTHVMIVNEALTAMTLVKKPEVVTAQIHDASNDIIEIMATMTGAHNHGNGTFDVCYRLNGTLQSSCLATGVAIGQKYTIQFTASGGRIVISYNGTQKANISQSGSGWYFKAGSYVQSNSTTKGFDSPSSYGDVTIYGLTVTHS